MSTYKLTQEAAAVKALKDALASFEDETLVADAIEGETEFLELVDEQLDAMDEDSSMVDAINKRLLDLNTRSGRLLKRLEHRKAAIETAMHMTGIKRLERPTATLTMAKRAPGVLITDESQVPEQYLVQRAPTVDRRAIKAALDAREHVPGATLTNTKLTLTVRRG